tara:strand:+ start:235 stop:480 length:246 start_codon:yes stop_codon:yes gene_type:complete
MSGQNKYRDLWEQYYDASEGIIFVVDSADKIRIKVAKNELDLILQNQSLKLREVPIVIFANKMDLTLSMSAHEVAVQLELD